MLPAHRRGPVTTMSVTAPPVSTALDLTTGKVIGAPHSRHRAQEFLAFLKKINSEAPGDLDIHLVLDNAATPKTPAVQRWLAAHHRFVLHFTPTSSPWINMVERGFPS